MEFLKKKQIITIFVLGIFLLLIFAGVAAGRKEAEKKVEELPAEELLVEEVPVEELLVEEVPAKELLVEEVPAKELLVEEVPGEELSVEESAAEAVSSMEEETIEEGGTGKAMKESETNMTLELPEMDVESTPQEIVQGREEREEIHTCSFEIFLTEASCLVGGKIEERCSDCGKVNMAEEIDPLGHDMKLAVWEAATCLKGGFYNNICQRCGLVENITEEPLPHDVEDVVVQEGNCMEDTIIRHVCKSCGQQVESDTRYTPQTHHWVQELVDGSTVLQCQWCGVVQ